MGTEAEQCARVCNLKTALFTHENKYWTSVSISQACALLVFMCEHPRKFPSCALLSYLLFAQYKQLQSQLCCANIMGILKESMQLLSFELKLPTSRLLTARPLVCHWRLHPSDSNMHVIYVYVTTFTIHGIYIHFNS